MKASGRIFLLALLAGMTVVLLLQAGLASVITNCAAAASTPPAFSPNGGSYPSARSVTIVNIASGDIAYYTIDGSDPRSSNTAVAYTENEPFTVDQSETVGAAVYDDSGGWSAVVSATFTINGSDVITITAPAIEPDGGAFTTAQTVSITDIPSGDTAYYTTDGSNPTSTGGTAIAYTEAFTVNQSEVINTAVFDSTNGWSSITTATFTIGSQTQPAAPTITPGGGAYATAQTVSIAGIPSGDTAYYTTDGSNPTSGSTAIAYTGAFTVSQSETVQAAVKDPVAGWGSIASATFVIGSSAQSSSPSTFTDLPTTFWAYDAIEALNAQGLISGYPDGTFKPDQVITRAEFVTLLVKSLKLPVLTPATPTFTDVNTSDWFYGAVETAYKNGLASGYTGSEFSPNAPISRQEITVMLVQALGKVKDAAAYMNTATSFTDDSSIASWARGFVNIAVKEGLISGYPGGSFGPTSSATRAEACEMMNSLLKQI